MKEKRREKNKRNSIGNYLLFLVVGLNGRIKENIF
jgi:hypothetical protein